MYGVKSRQLHVVVRSVTVFISQTVYDLHKTVPRLQLIQRRAVYQYTVKITGFPIVESATRNRLKGSKAGGQCVRQPHG